MDFMTVMGALGGWLEIIVLTFGFLVNLIASKKYIATIIRRLYMVKKMPAISPKHDNKCIHLCRCFNREAWKNLKVECALAYNMWDFVERQRYQFVKNILQQKKHMHHQIREHLINSIMNRQQFKYSKRDLANYFFHCICCKSLKTLRKTQEYRQHFRLLQGEEKFLRELDVVKLLKAVRDVRVMKQSNMSQLDQMLLKYQKQRTIMTDNSEDAEEKYNFTWLLEH